MIPSPSKLSKSWIIRTTKCTTHTDYNNICTLTTHTHLVLRCLWYCRTHHQRRACLCTPPRTHSVYWRGDSQVTITCKGMTYFLKCLNFLAGNISKCVKSLSISSTAISCRDAGGSVVLCGVWLDDQSEVSITLRQLLIWSPSLLEMSWLSSRLETVLPCVHTCPVHHLSCGRGRASITAREQPVVRGRD